MSLKEYKNILSKINYKNSFKPTETSRVMYSSIIEELLNSDNLKKKKILDLGCGCGILTILLNQKFPNNTFYASDLDEGALLDSKENFDNFNLNINIHKSNIFDEWLKRKEKFDLIINDISGVSSYLIEETDWFNNSIPSEDKDGFELLKKQFAQNAIVVFDDIHWSSEMTNAWRRIMKDNSVYLSIDFFKLGIIIFNSKQKSNCFKKYNLFLSH